MKGSVYQRCSCRDQRRAGRLGRKCPDLKKKVHALGWFYRYDAPKAPGENRRQPEVGPFRTKGEAEEELSATLAQGRRRRGSHRPEPEGRQVLRPVARRVQAPA